MAGSVAAQALRDIEKYDLLVIAGLDTRRGLAFARKWRAEKTALAREMMLDFTPRDRRAAADEFWKSFGAYNPELIKKHVRIDLDSFARTYKGGRGRENRNKNGPERGTGIRNAGFTRRPVREKRGGGPKSVDKNI